MIHSAEKFVKNEHKPYPFQYIHVYRHARTLLDELRGGHLEQEIRKLSTLVPFLHKNIQQTRITLHSILSLFILTTHSFDYDESDKSEK